MCRQPHASRQRHATLTLQRPFLMRRWRTRFPVGVLLRVKYPWVRKRFRFLVVVNLIYFSRCPKVFCACAINDCALHFSTRKATGSNPGLKMLCSAMICCAPLWSCITAFLYPDLLCCLTPKAHTVRIHSQKVIQILCTASPQKYVCNPPLVPSCAWYSTKAFSFLRPRWFYFVRF